MIISQPQTALLSALFLSSGPTITGRAVALANIDAGDAGCVLTLNKHPIVDLSLSGNVNLNLSTCALYDNSSDKPGALSMSGSVTVNAKAAYIVGTIDTSGGASLNTTDGTFTGVNPINDPYAGVAVPSYSGCNQTNYSKSGQQSDSISAGTTPYVFCNGLKLTGQSSLTLGPGVYVIDQGTLDLSGGTTLTATGGVTIVLTNHNGGSPADIKISGGATVNIVAPTSGSTAGIALFQDRVACSSCSDQITGGGTMNITGAIYFPSNSLTFTGGASSGGASSGGAQCTQLIALTITFTGNSNLQTNCSSAGTKTINATNGRLVM